MSDIRVPVVAQPQCSMMALSSRDLKGTFVMITRVKKSNTQVPLATRGISRYCSGHPSDNGERAQNMFYSSTVHAVL